MVPRRGDCHLESTGATDNIAKVFTPRGSSARSAEVSGVVTGSCSVSRLDLRRQARSRFTTSTGSRFGQRERMARGGDRGAISVPSRHPPGTRGAPMLGGRGSQVGMGDAVSGHWSRRRERCKSFDHGGDLEVLRGMISTRRGDRFIVGPRGRQSTLLHHRHARPADIVRSCRG
jgi:hypothetical protein